MQSILQALMKYCIAILICAILGGFAGWGLSKWVFSPVYESSVMIFAWESNQDVNPVNSTTAMKSIELDLNSRLVNDYKEIITSRKVQDEVSRLKQQKFINEPRKNKINTDIQRNTRMIKIVASSSNPDAAVFVANTTAEVFINVVKDIMNLKSIQIIDAGELPKKTVKPNPVTNTILSLIHI